MGISGFINGQFFARCSTTAPVGEIDVHLAGQAAYLAGIVFSFSKCKTRHCRPRPQIETAYRFMALQLAKETDFRREYNIYSWLSRDGRRDADGVRAQTLYGIIFAKRRHPKTGDEHLLWQPSDALDMQLTGTWWMQLSESTLHHKFSQWRLAASPGWLRCSGRRWWRWLCHNAKATCIPFGFDSGPLIKSSSFEQ